MCPQQGPGARQISKATEAETFIKFGSKWPTLQFLFQILSIFIPFIYFIDFVCRTVRLQSIFGIKDVHEADNVARFVQRRTLK